MNTPTTAFIHKNGNPDGLLEDREGHLFKYVPPTDAPDDLQPYSHEAEQAVLASLLIDPGSIIEIATFLKPNDFFIERNRWIYEACLKLYEAGTTIDSLTVSDELKKQDRLDQVTDTYLFGLDTPSSAHVEFYARIVARSGFNRRLKDAGEKLVVLAYQDTPIEDATSQAETIMQAATSGSTENKVVHIGKGLSEYLDRLAHLSKHTGQVTGIPTGLIDLDRLLGGLQKSDMIVMAGRPGMGKTSLALSIAHRAARRWQKRVAIFSLEMSTEQLTQRLVSVEAGIDSQRLRLGQIGDDEWSRLYEAMAELDKSSIYIDDTPAITISDLRTKARCLHAEKGLDLIIIDYLQLMTGSQGRENRQQEVSEISRGVKALAKELNIPILALSQLSRQVESRHDKRPILSDLRESGALEQDADVVLFIYRDEMYNSDTEFPNVAEILVGKHRNGPTGIFSVYFKSHLCQFVDLEVRRHLAGEAMPL